MVRGNSPQHKQACESAASLFAVALATAPETLDRTSLDQRSISADRNFNPSVLADTMPTNGRFSRRGGDDFRATARRILA